MKSPHDTEAAYKASYQISSSRGIMRRGNELMKNAIDLHMHIGPSSTQDRSVDAFEAAKQASMVGMKAIVFKDHAFPTVDRAYFTNKYVKEWAEKEGCKPTESIGSIVLNYSVGGINADAVEHAAKLGAKVVWLPTLSASNHLRMKGQEGGISIIDSKGEPTMPLKEVLQKVGEYNLLLGSGHITTDEIFVLLDEAKRAHIDKVLIDHPSEYGTPIDSLKEMTKKGAVIGVYAAVVMPFVSASLARSAIDEFAEIPSIIWELGEDHIILASDLGQYYNPDPVNGLRLFVINLLTLGISDESIKDMVIKTPARLLGLE
jgi:PHP family Zn ribbon phosphoesterase